MKNLSCVGLVVVATACSNLAAAAEDLRRTWTLYHSMNPKLGDSGFSKRGVVTLEPSSDEQANVQLTVQNEESSFTAKDLETIMSSGWYQVKLVEDGSGNEAVPPVMTTVPACQLRRANFRDEITLAFGQQGHVISLAYSPLVSPLAPKSCDDLVPLDDGEINFTSKIEYETAVPGMSLKTILPNYQPPPGLKFLPGSGNNNKQQKGGAMGGGGDAKPEGFETKPEGSEPPNSIMGFLQRYWYICCPSSS